MKRCCPECKLTNIVVHKHPESGKFECLDCGKVGVIDVFPVGEYQLPLPDMQTKFDEWCDEMKISKEGYFYKNASKMCASVIEGQLKPWKDENKKLKLLIEVMESKVLPNEQKDFVEAALNYIKDGEDMIQTEDGILVLSFQHTEI